jgi:hypothetical protein
MIPGIGLREHYHVREIRHGVKANCKPQAPRSPNVETPEQAEKTDARRINPIFHRLEEVMRGSKDC